MTFQERTSASEEYLRLSNRLVGEGESAAAGEMLWGAVHNAIQGIGVRHGLLDDREEIRRAVVVSHLVNVHGYSDFLYDQLRSAGRLHGHFYNRNLPEHDLPGLMRETRQYIATLLSIAATP